MIFSSVARVRDVAGQAVSETDGAAPAAFATEAGMAGESFDALMNSLLGAVCPAATTASVAEEPIALASSPPDTACAITADGENPVTTTDVVTDLEAMAACLPVPSAAATLPPGGKMLPSAAEDSAPDTAIADAVDDLAALLPQGAVIDPPPAPTAVVTEGYASPSVPAVETAAVMPDIAPSLPVAPAADAAPVPGGQPHMPAAVEPSAPAAAAPSPLAASAAVPSLPASSLPIPASPPPPAPAEPAAREATVARTETAQRADAPLPLPADADTGRQAATQEGDTQGQARLQELLAKLGADGAARGPGENFRSLLQGAEGGTPANAAALTYAQAGPAGPARDPAVPNLPVHTPLRHPEWSDEVSQRIRWAIGNQVQSAELKINPPQLGPVEVRVSVDADKQMTVTLSSQHVLVRETLQESLPRLRDLMSEHGFGAVNVDVSQHSSSDGRGTAAQADTDPALPARGDVTDADAVAPQRHQVRGLVDLYA